MLLGFPAHLSFKLFSEIFQLFFFVHWLLEYSLFEIHKIFLIDVQYFYGSLIRILWCFSIL